jgi:hypothetical protein
MKVAILAPRRADDGPRDRIWEWCRRRWETYHPDFDIHEGIDDGPRPFNRSAAINRAARAAGDWDVAITIDADVFLKRSSVRDAVALADASGKVVWPHRRWRGLSESWTQRVLADRRDFGAEVDREDMDVLVERTNPISWSCCIAIPRAIFDDMGGFDERFVGWGYEDMAFQSLVVGLYGHERLEGDVYHLWHPRSEERIEKGKPATTQTREYAINALLGRRYMMALRRDHGLHDRPGLPVSEDERQRDMANIRRDDAKVFVTGRHHKLPEWQDWWPTLEELRDGAKDRTVEPASSPTVTIIVHTGGLDATWIERSDYLARSLASLTEHVKGNIVQRVIYSDWGEDHREELEGIARSFGFYVAGDGHHGYTASMQRMWRYLSKRAQGEFIFQAEDDFLYDRDVDLDAMARVLEAQPKLLQLALLRDPYYQDEKETGGILGWPEPAFTRVGSNGTVRLEHRLFFTANPSLFRRSLTETPWPSEQQSRRILKRREDQMPSSETAFGQIVLADPDARVAFWGEGEQWISHIGAVRAGVGY